MPMGSNEEHGAQDPNNPYCVNCTDMKGKLLPFDKKFEELVNVAMSTRWMTREQAIRHVLEEMSRMPAWKDKVESIRPA